MPDGKPENRFAFNGEFKDAAFANKEHRAHGICWIVGCYGSCLVGKLAY